MRRSPILAAVAAGLLLVGTACGSDDDAGNIPQTGEVDLGDTVPPTTEATDASATTAPAEAPSDDTTVTTVTPDAESDEGVGNSTETTAGGDTSDTTVTGE